MDPKNIAIIVDMRGPRLVNESRTTLGHTKFIRNYANITVPLEKMLRKDTKYMWTQECKGVLDMLKEKLVTASIPIFLDWTKLFNVHVDASSIAHGTILVQLGEGNIDHPISFASRKILDSERNYTTTEREYLAMVYV